MIRNSIKISKYSRMNGSNLSFYLLNDLFNFVPSSPRFITYYEPVSFSYRFHRRANFFEVSISHYSTRCQPTGLYFFSTFPSSILFFPGPDHSWEPDRLFASLDTRVRQFATPRYKNSHLGVLEQKKRARKMLSYQHSRESTYATLFSFVYFIVSRINLTRVTDLISANVKLVYLCKVHVALLYLCRIRRECFIRLY